MPRHLLSHGAGTLETVVIAQRDLDSRSSLLHGCLSPAYNSF